MPTTIAILGATGMLARPLVRRLTDEGLHVRALTRNPQRARTLLPATCELIQADAADSASIQRTITGADALYINLAHPFSEHRPDPELSGNTAAIAAARAAGVRRVLRISAYAVNEADPWWLIRRKAQSDAALIDSGLDYTIFRPSWFMESLPLFVMGRTMMLTDPGAVYHWITGDDYAKQVTAALRNPAAINRIYPVQGPTPLTMREAVTRFARTWTPRPFVIPMPALARKLGRITPAMRYLDDLLAYYHRAETSFTSQQTWTDLGEPTMTIEDYTGYARRTSDIPHK